jgi:preprotein translocase subunit YajC
MAYATGLRLLATFCFFTIVLSPFGLFFWLMARRKEKEAEQRTEALQKLAEEK